MMLRKHYITDDGPVFAACECGSLLFVLRVGDGEQVSHIECDECHKCRRMPTGMDDKTRNGLTAAHKALQRLLAEATDERVVEIVRSAKHNLSFARRNLLYGCGHGRKK